MMKVRLNSRETVWVRKCGEDFVRIANIPLTSPSFGFDDVVILQVGADGMLEIAELIESAGYFTNVFVLPKDHPQSSECLRALDGIAIHERIDDMSCAIAAKGSNWNAVFRIINAHPEIGIQEMNARP
jgi:hypothetical protein